MNNIRPRDLAVVVQGLWPNVGRIVYVCEFVPHFDFGAMGLDKRDGWRVRSWSCGPLETTEGPRNVGITPIGSLRRLDRLPPQQQQAIDREMALMDFQDAALELARYFEMQEALETAELLIPAN
jgi:hypothetical protein